MTQKKISVVIVEDDEQIREGISTLIKSSDGFLLKGAYGECQSLLKEIDDLLPDVLLMDISLPGISGIDCTKKIKESFPAANVIMLTVYDDDEKIFESLRSGASGYILKRASLDQILEAIRDVHNGGAPMTPSIARRVLKYFDQSSANPNEFNLTKRENEILHELVEGLSYKKISEKLFISLDTVRSHIKNIYQKLHVNSKSEAILKTLQKKSR